MRRALLIQGCPLYLTEISQNNKSFICWRPDAPRSKHGTANALSGEGYSLSSCALPSWSDYAWGYSIPGIKSTVYPIFVRLFRCDLVAGLLYREGTCAPVG